MFWTAFIMKTDKNVQFRPKTVQIGRNRPTFEQVYPTHSRQYQLGFFFLFFLEHLRDCILSKNLTRALYIIPFKRYDLCPITHFTYVLEEVYNISSWAGQRRYLALTAMLCI